MKEKKKLIHQTQNIMKMGKDEEEKKEKKKEKGKRKKKENNVSQW